MYKIIKKKILNPNVTEMDVYAPLVAKKAQPGQFIILRVAEDGERIPLTIAGSDPVNGTVKIIFQIVGATTLRLGELSEGECIHDFVGPLGTATDIDGLKKTCIIGGGVGCAIALPIAKALHDKGCEVVSVVGFRSKDLVILEDEFKSASDKLYIMTDDGSYGEKGNVSQKLSQVLENESFDKVITIGPLVMMKSVVETVRPTGIPCVVSMNPIMIDGTGMCGGCRLTLHRNGESVKKFACVDGPDFNGYEVDFDEAISRSRLYRNFERQAYDEACNLFKKEEEVKNVLNAYPMPVQEPDERIHNFDEVALGYSEEDAVNEANRCLNCKNKPCMKGCPVKIDIPAFISKIKERDFEGAYAVISESSCLPAVCGRVCPQENQCEKMCVRGIKGDSVCIGRLERFVADRHNELNKDVSISVNEKNGKKVAVIGSGPSGLTCAGELIKNGYDVTVFEALHTEGGVLTYGIPEFRLPKKIVKDEVEQLERAGVKFMTNTVIGKTLTIDELFDDGYDAVYIGSGAGLPRFMGIEGENLNGVYSANEFLTRINLMKAYEENDDTPVVRGKRVAVVGGGNVAMDAARCARRLGGEVTVIYRRSADELPARKEEAEHAKEEGIEFRYLTSPIEIKGDENGFVSGIVCQRMELGEPDESGRRSPVAIEGSEEELSVDCVIMAIGTSPNPLIRSTTEGLDTNRRGGIITDDDGKSSRDAVYAGGDAVTGSATVISAMGAGKAAAKSIDDMLSNK